MELREKIKAADDIEREIVNVPEWDGVDIEVRTLSGCERAQVFADATDEDGKVDTKKSYVNLLIASCYDPETGERVFKPEDGEWLSKKSSQATERLATVAYRLSGLTKAASEGAEKK